MSKFSNFIFQLHSIVFFGCTTVKLVNISMMDIYISSRFSCYTQHFVCTLVTRPLYLSLLVELSRTWLAL